ncbi:MAG: Asp23/Gls24 family envelope stress response protein [Clostridia bacterium]|nr:Asp23/Gls24 family envelope stress response protein [Clostridia bacterium]
MSVTTSNYYGKIVISDEAIAAVAASAAIECYGVVDLVSKKLSDNFAEIFKKQQLGKGVKVITNENKIFIDIYVVLKYGVSISAVAESLKKAVKYRVEEFSGMIVDTVNINVVGVRV